MKFTSVVLEYVLIGFQVLAWLVLFVFLCWGDSWLKADQLKEWSTQLSLLAVGAAYMLGVVFDRLASFIRLPWPSTSSLASLASLPSPIAMRMAILVKNPEAYRELEQLTRNTWLLRSTSVNFVLIVLFGGLYVIIRRGASWWLFPPLVILALATLGTGLLAWRRSAILSLHEVAAAYQALREIDGPRRNNAQGGAVESDE